MFALVRALFVALKIRKAAKDDKKFFDALTKIIKK